MAIAELDSIARALAAELRSPARRSDLVARLRRQGLSAPEATAVVSYAVASRLLVEAGDLLRSASPPSPSPPSAAPAPPGWILVVEDDEACATAVKQVLEVEASAEVRIAQNGKQALRLLARSERPRLILLDLMMPLMSGWELLEILREDDELRDVPVVIITASSQVPDRLPALRKPLRLDELLQVVDRMASAG